MATNATAGEQGATMGRGCLYTLWNATLSRSERTSRCLCVGILLAWLMPPVSVSLAVEPQYVVNISVDGLGSSYLNALINTDQLPNFRRLQLEGAWTNNARNDYDNTVTLPNHTTMITGRGVAGPDGHNYIDDGTPAPGVTIHSNKGSYVASVFDAAHDNGLRTALFANKSKFSLFRTSYDAANGAPDLIRPDNGTNKIDQYIYSGSSSATLVNSYVSYMTATPAQYSFVHFRGPDDTGHSTAATGGWGNTDYNNSVKDVDSYLGAIFNLIDTDPTLTGKTAIILTADHGGKGTSHSNITAPLDYTIPFYAWGPGVTAGADLYAINAATRLDPGGSRPAYGPASQPIRNGDIANLSLGLLRLGPILNSTINVKQDLAISGSAPSLPILVARNYFLQQPADTTSWTPGTSDVELGFSTTSTNLGPTPKAQVYTSATSPWRFRMQSIQADTTFASVDLAPYQGTNASIDIMLKSTPYDSSDYFRATLTNGADTITLAEASGVALNVLKQSAWLHYSAAIPDSWTTAVLKISGSTNADTKAIDFDNIEFYARPTLVNGAWNAAAAGSDWSDPAKWSGRTPSQAGDTAYFGPTAAKGAAAVSLDGSRTLSGLRFSNSAGYLLTGALSDVLTLSNGVNYSVPVVTEGTAGSHEIAVAVALASDLDVRTSSGTTLTISGNIVGGRALAKSGNGILVFSGSNTYSGDTTVQAGLLKVAAVAGSALGGGNLNLAGGVLGLGESDFTRALGTEAGQVQWSATGGFAAYGADRAVRLGDGSPVTWNAGDFVPDGASLVLGAASADKTLDFQNGIDLGAASRTIQVEDGSADVDARLSGKLTNGALVKSGGGTLELTNAANDYAGGTTVAAGTLQVTNAGALPSGGDLMVVGGGTVVLQSGMGAALTASAPGTQAVPEPSTFALLGVGALGLLAYAWRRRASA
jgi:autotransporter-associated beta strand protein